jgi:hypothetical protein
MKTELTNRYRNGSRIGIGIVVLGAACIFGPTAAGMDGMNGGFALSFLGLFIAIVGCVAAWAFRAMSARVDKVLSGDGLLAHWALEPDVWRRYTESEFEETKRDKMSLLKLILIIAAVVCVGLTVAHHDAAGIMAILWVSMAVILGITAFLSSRVADNRNRQSRGEIVVSRFGVVMPGEAHFWGILGARLTGAAVRNGDPALLVVEYSVPSRQGYQQNVARAPIPPGAEDEARGVAESLLAGAGVRKG